MRTKFILPAVALVALAVTACEPPEEDTQGKKSSTASAAGEVGNWKILTKNPKFTKEFGMFSTVKLKVKNVSNGDDEPWLEIRLTNKKGDLVTSFDCIGDTVEPGQSTVLDCTSLDDYAKFSDYEIKNAF